MIELKSVSKTYRRGPLAVEALRRIDFYFYTLRELREELVRALEPLRGKRS